MALGSSNLLQWEIIKKLKSLGVREYDFVGGRVEVPKGSKLEGIQRFKQRFG
jgi:lipid II:glycine glycyltransferase (peptidoglycan interpeptide bridge formation enzyme)